MGKGHTGLILIVASPAAVSLQFPHWRPPIFIMSNSVDASQLKSQKWKFIMSGYTRFVLNCDLNILGNIRENDQKIPMAEKKREKRAI